MNKKDDPTNKSPETSKTLKTCDSNSEEALASDSEVCKVPELDAELEKMETPHPKIPVQHSPPPKNRTSALNPQPAIPSTSTSWNEEMEGGYRYPKKTTPLSALRAVLGEPTFIRNRYDPITPKRTSEDTEKDEENCEDNAETEITQRTKQRRTGDSTEDIIRRKTMTTLVRSPQKTNNKIKPPPIILDGRFRTTTEKLVKTIKPLLTKDFYIKNSRNSTIIQTDELDDYNKVLELIDESNYNYHTYTPRQGKTHAFVMRGYCEADTDQILSDLQKLKINVQKVHKMKSKATTTDPEHNYLVITDNKHTLTTMRPINALNHIRIYWERRKNDKKITQCMRCQKWGHAASNCRRQIACVICAGEHGAKDCPRPKTHKPTCANCAGPHTACNRQECPVYINKVKYMTNSEENKTKTITDETRRTNSPPIISNLNFPALKTKTPVQETAHQTRQTGELSYAQTIMNNRPTNINKSNRTGNETYNQFQELNETIGEIGGLVDISRCIAHLQDLRDTLKSIPNKIAREKQVIMFLFSYEMTYGQD